MDLGDEKDNPTLKLPELYKFVDDNNGSMIDVLRQAVAFPCLSLEDEHFPDVTKMLEFCQTIMKDFGASTELITSKNLKTNEGSSYPPVLFGNLFIDEELKTICVYGHVDTLTTSNDQSFEADKFNLTVKNGTIHGSGLSMGKGPLTCWLNALKIYRSTKIPIPVNIKFIVEGLAQLNSPTLDHVVHVKKSFFRDVDYICLTIDKTIDEHPCLRYGYRGICHFNLDVRCGNENIDSGSYGGVFNQPLIDAVHVVSSLVDDYDKLAVPNVMKDVVPPSNVDDHAKNRIKVNVEDLAKKIGVKRLRHVEMDSLIIHQTRLPSISVHGFETGSRSCESNRAEVPCGTVAKFSIRLVPNQTSRDTRVHVENYVKSVWSSWKSVNDIRLDMNLGVDPWKEDPTSSHYDAAAGAIRSVYGKEPSYVCDGCSMPAASILKTISPQSSSLVLSLGDSNDENENDESMSMENYNNGVKVIMAYMCGVHEI